MAYDDENVVNQAEEETTEESTKEVINEVEEESATYAIIEDGVCINVILSGATYAVEIGAVLLPEGYGIGDLYNGSEWSKAPVPEPTPELEGVEQRLSQLEEMFGIMTEGL